MRSLTRLVSRFRRTPWNSPWDYGLAVVAGEVRMLAQRAAAAAKEIGELVESSASNVQAGGRLVNEAGASMNEMVNAVRRVNALIETVADSAQAQRHDARAARFSMQWRPHARWAEKTSAIRRYH
ncbi:MAG TPA: methyl-accepting chemotaxis protein [Trinickia sp.]|jgi:hypothetical protein|nr:methyl-accepting chemotaxis protein [Trinickia sp.]